MKKLLTFIFFSLFLFSNEPYKKIITKNFIISSMLYKDILYVSTNNGVVEVYNIKSKKNLYNIKLDSIKDYLNNDINPKIFQTHTIDGKNILILSQDSNGDSKLFIYDGLKLNKININSEPIIKKAYFVDNENILLGFLSNEIWLYNIKTNSIIWRQKPSDAVFSDLIINDYEDYEAISTTEGGIIYIIDLKNGNIKKELKGANFDNIYTLVSVKNIILSAGRDRICGIYNKDNNKFRRLHTEFLSYVVGLSKDSTLGAVSYNEDNDILIFKIKNLDRISLLKGGDALPNTIIFINNKSIIASFDSKSILFWNIKGE
ncbi:WD40 repeat domain-containing protein [Helicobacter sp. MIT 14-3879]|uniref:WD40 repeat domain-containing protein n=1 Tax=Helicobacter sp. MIT 14-3879 TaxID=2040649 RepID=UPI000E1F8273|nr:WD40 repeat domain-containing protein [Helicobacter sp. MIT 14-3879]RDU63478.1 hypothetical protein CQA44_05150 [Helicobacter sp. MIT 14-3879]